jgi:hypothetical protein
MPLKRKLGLGTDLLAEAESAARIMQRGVREALLRHKLLGQSIVVWRNGRVVVLPPEKIDVGDGATRRAKRRPRRVRARR